MAKSCAYCDAPPPLTREHIWPNGFLKRGDFGVKFSAKANKTFTGDLTISDVCAKCNNGPLSTLDAHACEVSVGWRRQVRRLRRSVADLAASSTA